MCPRGQTVVYGLQVRNLITTQPAVQTIFTLGHSTHTLERLVELLRQHAVTAVADVRSTPFSRMNPQFSQNAFSAALQKHQIAYAFLGRELGARPDDQACYVDGRAQFNRIAQTPLFASGLDRIATGLKKYRLALVCAEKEPITCHRAILVSRHLIRRGFAVNHILSDGTLEAHKASLERLAAQLGMPLNDLFRSYDELIDNLYDRQARAIGYTLRKSPQSR